MRKVYLFVKVGVNTTFDPEELKSIVTDSLIRAGFESVHVHRTVEADSDYTHFEELEK